MLDELFITQPWTGIALWVVLYCSDYAITIACARMLRSGADKHLVLESFELTPYFQKDIASLRRISPRFLLMLLISTSLLVAIWAWAARLAAELPWSWNMYRMFLGALICVELAVHVRHVTNLVMFARARDSKGVSGQIRYAQWVTYQWSSIQIVAFAAVYLFSFGLTMNWFFAGGFVKCFVESLRHWRLYRKHLAISNSKIQAGAEIEAGAVGTAP
jgi:hypothetical protein